LQKDKSESAITNIDSLDQLAIKNYNEAPHISISAFEQISKYSRKVEDFRKSGTANLNIAGIYDEKFKSYSEALKYSLESMKDWEALGDSMQIANLKKYIGFLHGQDNNFVEAEKHVHEAIKIYRILDFKEGIAVSKINLSKIKLKEAIQYFNESKSFWQSKNKKSRIFDNNLVGIELFNELNNNLEVNSLIRENEKILKNLEINKFLMNKFEELKASL